MRKDVQIIELFKSFDGNNRPKRRSCDIIRLDMSGNIIDRLLA